MKVTSLRIHPVKSTAIRQVTTAHVGLAGLRGDREWMVVDTDAAMVSARELPELFLIRADPVADGGLVLRADGMPELPVPVPNGDRVDVTMFGGAPMPALRASSEAAAWLSQATGRAGLSLVWCCAPEERQLNPQFSTGDDQAAFQDGYPLTVASMASLARLNDWILASGGDALTVDRFRPNIVIDGNEPFAEDTWHTVQVGAVRFRAAKSVDRCSMTLIDPVTLDRGKEPIRTLSQERKWDGKTWFCHHLIPDGEGTIEIGDEVTAH